MKTQLIALIACLASTPVGASINASEDAPLDLAPQPATYQAAADALHTARPERRCRRHGCRTGSGELLIGETGPRCNRNKAEARLF